jgi:hypothetical protein
MRVPRCTPVGMPVEAGPNTACRRHRTSLSGVSGFRSATVTNACLCILQVRLKQRSPIRTQVDRKVPVRLCGSRGRVRSESVIRSQHCSKEHWRPEGGARAIPMQSSRRASGSMASKCKLPLSVARESRGARALRSRGPLLFRAGVWMRARARQITLVHVADMDLGRAPSASSPVFLEAETASVIHGLPRAGVDARSHENRCVDDQEQRESEYPE